MTEDQNFSSSDWNLSTWEGVRRVQMKVWASMSLDRILEAQEEMADLSRELARQCDTVRDQES